MASTIVDILIKLGIVNANDVQASLSKVAEAETDLVDAGKDAADSLRDVKDVADEGLDMAGARTLTNDLEELAEVAGEVGEEAREMLKALDAVPSVAGFNEIIARVRELKEGLSATGDGDGENIFANLRKGLSGLTGPTAQLSRGALRIGETFTKGFGLAKAAALGLSVIIAGKVVRAIGNMIQAARDAGVVAETLDSLADSAERVQVALGTSLIRIIESIGKSTGIADTADAYATLMEEVAKGNITQGEANVIMARAGFTTGSLRDEVNKLTEGERSLSEEQLEVNRNIARFTRETEAAAAASRKYAKATAALRSGQVDGLNTQIQFTASIRDTGEAMGELAEEEDDLLARREEIGDKPVISQDDLEKIVEAREQIDVIEVKLQRQNMGTKKRNELLDAQAATQQKINELVGEGFITPAEARELEEINGKLDENKQKVIELQEAWAEQTKAVLFNLIQQKLAIDGFDDIEISGLFAVAEAFGMLGDVDLGAIDQIFRQLKSGALDPEGFAAAFTDVFEDITPPEFEETGTQVDEGIIEPLTDAETQAGHVERQLGLINQTPMTNIPVTIEKGVIAPIKQALERARDVKLIMEELDGLEINMTMNIDVTGEGAAAVDAVLPGDLRSREGTGG